MWQTPMYWPKFQYQSISERNTSKASIRRNGHTNAKTATMGPEQKPTMLNTILQNMVPGWSTVRPRNLWITLAKNARKMCKGPASLQRHTQRDKCMLQKKFQCPQYLKLFKEQARRDTHIQTYHSEGGAKTWTCETCGRVMNSLGAHINHQLWHRGLTAQRRARRICERNLQNQNVQDTAKGLGKKGSKAEKVCSWWSLKICPSQTDSGHKATLPGSQGEVKEAEEVRVLKEVKEVRSRVWIRKTAELLQKTA